MRDEPDTGESRELRAPGAPPVGAAIVAVALSIVFRSLLGTKLLAEIVVDASTSALQPGGFSFLLQLLDAWGKPLLFLSVLIAQAALYVLVWRQAQRRVPGSVVEAALVAALGATGVLLVASLLLVLLTDAELGSSTSWLEYSLVTLGSSLVFGGLTALSRYERKAEVEDASRRAFLLRMPGLVLGAGAMFVLARQLIQDIGAGAQTSHEGKITPEVTPNDDFYIVSKNLIDPDVDAGDWRLRVGGASQQMVEISYRDILALPTQEQYTTLQCISNDVNGDLMSNALWVGVPLRDILAKVQPKPSATHVIFRSEDDYTESLPLDFAMMDGVVVVHTMNGVPLPRRHGFPLRVLAPGKYGFKNPKWLTEIQLMERESFGYWEKRGWSPEGLMNTTCRIDIPAPEDLLQDVPYRIHGIAFSGRRGITRVEVSTDNGRTWADAVVKPALGPYTWVLWYYDWLDLGPDGRRTVVARATDGTGATQTSERNPPEPSGATGYPKVSVTIRRLVPQATPQ